MGNCLNGAASEEVDDTLLTTADDENPLAAATSHNNHIASNSTRRRRKQRVFVSHGPSTAEMEIGEASAQTAGEQEPLPRLSMPAISSQGPPHSRTAEEGAPAPRTYPVTASGNPLVAVAVTKSEVVYPAQPNKEGPAVPPHPPSSKSPPARRLSQAMSMPHAAALTRHPSASALAFIKLPHPMSVISSTVAAAATSPSGGKRPTTLPTSLPRPSAAAEQHHPPITSFLCINPIKQNVSSCEPAADRPQQNALAVAPTSTCLVCQATSSPVSRCHLAPEAAATVNGTGWEETATPPSTTSWGSESLSQRHHMPPISSSELHHQPIVVQHPQSMAFPISTSPGVETSLMEDPITQNDSPGKKHRFGVFLEEGGSDDGRTKTKKNAEALHPLQQTFIILQDHHGHRRTSPSGDENTRGGDTSQQQLLPAAESVDGGVGEGEGERDKDEDRVASSSRHSTASSASEGSSQRRAALHHAASVAAVCGAPLASLSPAGSSRRGSQHSRRESIPSASALLPRCLSSSGQPLLSLLPAVPSSSGFISHHAASGVGHAATSVAAASGQPPPLFVPTSPQMSDSYTRSNPNNSGGGGLLFSGVPLHAQHSAASSRGEDDRSIRTGDLAGAMDPSLSAYASSATAATGETFGGVLWGGGGASGFSASSTGASTACCLASALQPTTQHSIGSAGGGGGLVTMLIVDRGDDSCRTTVDADQQPRLERLIKATMALVTTQ